MHQTPSQQEKADAEIRIRKDGSLIQSGHYAEAVTGILAEPFTSPPVALEIARMGISESPKFHLLQEQISTIGINTYNTPSNLCIGVYSQTPALRIGVGVIILILTRRISTKRFPQLQVVF